MISCPNLFQHFAHLPVLASVVGIHVVPVFGTSPQRLCSRQVLVSARHTAFLHPEALRIVRIDYLFHLFCSFFINVVYDFSRITTQS